jgi:RNA polymerase sigma-70 factor (ECF subfamily)
LFSCRLFVCGKTGSADFKNHKEFGMKKIKYEINGKFIDIEVTDEFAAQYEQIEAEEKRIDRKETRRHQSLNALVDGGFQVVDPDSDIEEQLVNQNDIDLLHRALTILTDEQKWLVEQVFYCGRKQSDIAAELGICKQALNNRIARIIKKIKKFMN